ncbi:MAG: hypothetical protein ACTSYC_00295 [Promethearchaeota archaeon]
MKHVRRALSHAALEFRPLLSVITSSSSRMRWLLAAIMPHPSLPFPLTTGKDNLAKFIVRVYFEVW